MSADRLEAALRAVEPAARLVSERHLRKVLYTLRDRGHPVPANPDLPFWAGRAEVAAADVFPAALLAAAPDRVLLLTDPDDRNLTRLPPGEQLRAYWRVLFQAAVFAALDQKLREGKLTAAGCAERLGQLGSAAEREIRYVLNTEHYGDPRADLAGVYRTFAAVYLDLHCFTPAAVADFFPSLPEQYAITALLGVDLDVPSLLAHSRPAGAADPEPQPPPDPRWNHAGTGPATTALAEGADPGGQLAKATEAEAKGNFVRAAILRTQAAAAVTGYWSDRATLAAHASLARLVKELGRVFGWDEPTREQWRQALGPLLAPAAKGIWPRAARCLYELQKIPGELAREVYEVDLVEPIRTLGRRPMKRLLPHAPPVIRLVQLRAAEKQLLAAGLEDEARLRLDDLFHREIHRTEHLIRDNLTPVIAAALSEAGFLATNRVEEVARAKVVAELVDRGCEVGRLRLGDLRDAIARNQLKMPDLAGTGEFIGGDPLLRADTQLAYALDGVYRRGELYLRGLQRFSSIFFGTPTGRLAALYLIGPVLAAFLTLMFAEELRHLGTKAYTYAAKKLGPKPAPPPPAEPTTPKPPVEPTWDIDEDGAIVWTDPDLTSFAKAAITSSAATPTGDHPDHASILIECPTILGFALFLFLVFHIRPARRVVLAGLAVIARGVRLLLWDAPTNLWRAPLVTAVRHSAAARFINRHVRAPLVLSVLILLILFLVGLNPRLLWRLGWAIPAALVLAYNTPWGWVVQDRVAESVADGWRVVRVNLIPGLIGWVLDLFRAIANWIERRLYAVDEWLRFRSGDSQGSFVLKAVLGLVWFPFAYVTRFAFYLLLEPQINPVKHFPVVTVSHKVLLPLVLSPNPNTEPSVFGQVLVAQLGLGVSEANFWAFWIIASIPGIFGFIAWELMANWQLYRANRPDRLRAATIGSHGETMRGLLRPGFHSGTVPRVFRKLRKADRLGRGEAVGRYHHDLEHVQLAVRRFVERELLGLLRHSPEWSGMPVEIAAVHFGCQRVVVEIAISGLPPEPIALSFENRGGEIEAAIRVTDGLARLTAAQRSALLAGVRGLFDLGAATVFEGQPRNPDAGAGELARPYTWTEWVARWQPVLRC